MDFLSLFVGMMMVVVMHIAVRVQGAAYDAVCTGSGAGDCSEANNICDTGSKKCACSTTSFKTNATICAAKIALTGACTATPTGQCADLQAECHTTKHTCGCKSTHFANKAGACSQRVSFNTKCLVAETAPDQCVADTECKDDGKGAKKCLCKTTHFELSGVCTPRKKPSKSCAVNQCVPHANCTSGTNICECWPGYTALPTLSPTMCSGVFKVITLTCMYMVPILVSMMLL